MFRSLLLLALVAAAQGRAVNISNTWVLPEEGFPVFYRYFRDRISWYEADAVCQFHHANLVTVDTTAQYDAVRAYLKELDISSAVWVGLIRSNPDGDFTWTDYRGLSGDGYWSSAPDARSAPLCAASDPAADYRWEARACGGPSVASFICELPVPQWALGNEGCMVRALPALTVLYLPESAAVQLTADCGMAGVKRLQCTGNVKREDLLRDLSCAEDVEPSSPTTNVPSTATTWAETDQETNYATIEVNIPVEHEDETSTFNSISSTPEVLSYVSVTQTNVLLKENPTQSHEIVKDLNKDINLDVASHNNIQSNYIPTIVVKGDMQLNEQLQKQEDEKHMQHKLLHNELARLGNFENIFSQPTDHFVPPLVMAKAKVNDDMNSVTYEEKLAQQHTEYQRNQIRNNITLNTKNNDDPIKTTAAVSSKLLTTEIPLTSAANILKDKKEMDKNVLPKKYYDQTFADAKSKVKGQTTKSNKSYKTTTISTYIEDTKAKMEASTLKSVLHFDSSNEDNSLDLTVMIKEPHTDNINFNNTNTSQYDTLNDKELNENNNLQIGNESNTEFNIMQNITLNDEIIKVTFVQDDDYASVNSTVFEITTRMPIFKDNSENRIQTTSSQLSISTTVGSATPATDFTSVNKNVSASIDIKNTTNILEMPSTQPFNENMTLHFSKLEVTTSHNPYETSHGIEMNINSAEVEPHVKEMINNTNEPDSLDYFEKKSNDTSQYIDDFQSPLLSGASEPLHKPNRSRRPQQPNRIKKFNPFRILG